MTENSILTAVSDRSEKPEPGKVYTFDFRRGGMRPLVSDARFPVGAVLILSNRYSDRKRFVVTSGTPETYGQPVLGEDGQRTHCAAPCDGNQWRDSGEVLDADALAAFTAAALAEAARLKAEYERQQAEEAASRKAEREKIIAEFPWLELAAGSSKTPWALAASNIRKELARAFPGVKFSVKSDSYSMGCSVSVHWTLGPTEKEVKAISDKYQTDDFNGMEDISESRRAVWPEVFGGAKSVSETRDDGDALNIVCAGLCDLWGIEKPADGKSYWNIRRSGDGYGDNVSMEASRIINSFSYPPGAVITGVEACPEREDADLYGCTRFYRTIFTAPEVAPPAPKPDKPFRAAAPVPTVAGVQVTQNEEKNGVEIRFPSKPADSILERLKAAGWRWSRFSACWYSRRSPEALAFAAELSEAV